MKMHQYWSSSPIGFVKIRRRPPEELRNHSLFREFQSIGRFWLPNSPSDKMWGQLSFQPGADIIVTINNPPWKKSPRGGIDIPVMNGIFSDGTPFSLFNCNASVNVHYHEKKYYYAEIYCRYIILGNNFEKISDCMFSEMDLMFTHINKWFGSAYEINHKEDNRHIVTCNPEKLKIPIKSKNVQFKIESVCKSNMPVEMGSDRINWSYDYYLKIKPKSSQNLEWFITTASILRKCMIFLVGAAIYTLEIIPVFPKNDDNGKKIKVFGELLQEVDIPSFIRLDRYYFSTLYSNVVEDLPKFFQSWFEQEETLKHEINTYASVLLSEGASEESVFLRLVQTLEHFHGILFPENNKYFKNEIWKPLHKGLRKFIEQKLLDINNAKEENNDKNGKILAERIGSLNNLSIQSKLEQILTNIPRPHLMPLLRNPKSPDEAVKDFPKNITTTRHSLTHYSKKQEKKAFKEEELRKAVSSLWAILTYWIAQKLGFTEKTSSNMALKAMNAMFITSQKSGL